MTPTKEQLADPKWWDENAPGDEFNFFLVDADGAIKPCFNRIERGKYIDSDGVYWCAVDEVADAGAIVYSRPSRWPGKGLPPAGTVCEACYTSPDKYYQAKVLAHDDGKAVYRWLAGPRVGDICESDNRIFCKITGPHLKFRQIRTPEQLAAEEREAAIAQMKECFDSVSDRLMPTSNRYLETLFGALHDHGYRKTDQELVSALRSLAEAYRCVTGIDGAYDQEIRRAEEVLKRYE